VAGLPARVAGSPAGVERASTDNVA